MITGVRLRLIPPRRLRAGVVLDGVLFAAVHGGAVAALVLGGTVRLVVLAAILYATRLALLAAGYGAGFARGAFRMGRATQLAIAVLGTTAVARGPLWWASHQRSVHADPAFEGSGPLRRALIWLLLRMEEPRLDLVPDLAGYPELRFVDRWSRFAPFALAALLFAGGGLDALLWGGAVSTCLLFHTSTVIAIVPGRADRLGSASAGAHGAHGIW